MLPKSTKTKKTPALSKEKSSSVVSKSNITSSSVKNKRGTSVSKGKIGDLPKSKPGMRNLRKDDTGLPMNIWIDEGGSYKRGGHAPRVKVQVNTKPKISSNIPKNFFSIDLDGEEHDKKNKDIELSSKEIDMAKKYVRLNKALLQQIIKQQLAMTDEIVAEMKKNYENGT